LAILTVLLLLRPCALASQRSRLSQDPAPEIRAETAFCQDVDLAAQEIFDVKFEPDEIQKVPPGPKVDQEVQVALACRGPRGVGPETRKRTTP
jgi:PBP1b-binding outer membrane lipoprotein LpoB